MKFKDYICRNCGWVYELELGDCERFPRVLTGYCIECGYDMDMDYGGGIVHIPTKHQAVPTKTNR